MYNEIDPSDVLAMFKSGGIEGNMKANKIVSLACLVVLKSKLVFTPDGSPMLVILIIMYNSRHMERFSIDTKTGRGTDRLGSS